MQADLETIYVLKSHDQLLPLPRKMQKTRENTSLLKMTKLKFQISYLGHVNIVQLMLYANYDINFYI